MVAVANAIQRCLYKKSDSISSSKTIYDERFKNWVIDGNWIQSKSHKY